MKDKDFKSLKEAYNLVESSEFEAFKQYNKSRKNVFFEFFDKSRQGYYGNHGGIPKTDKIKLVIKFENLPQYMKYRFDKGEYGENYINDIEKYLDKRYIPHILDTKNKLEYWDYQNYERYTVNEVLINDFLMAFCRFKEAHPNSEIFK